MFLLFSRIHLSLQSGHRNPTTATSIFFPSTSSGLFNYCIGIKDHIVEASCLRCYTQF